MTAETRPASENVQLEQNPQSPSSIRGEMRIVARHHYEDAPVRDVYLLRIEGPASECLLWHTQCPLSLVASLEWIGRLLAAEIVYDPPGNCEPGWKWPAPDEPKPVKVGKPRADSALLFD